MRIDGMDAASTIPFKVSDSQTAVKAVKVESQSVKEDTVDIRKVGHLTQLEKRELPISEKVVIDAIEKANNAISGANRRFEFSIHEKTKEIMVKVINSDTNEVIREIPPEKILDMVATMWEMAGIIVDERR